jgi:protein-disulfide isomerase
MASRAEQKALARAKRIEYERKLVEDARRKQRLARLGGVVIAAAVIIVAAIVISSKNSPSAPVKPNSKASKIVEARVDKLLSGIPQSGNTLGSPNAPVQVTFYGDLECSACDYFADAPTTDTSDGIPGSGLENQLINTYVRPGQAQIVYRSLETATGSGATPDMFPTQQAAVGSAGLQQKAWYYIELFYNEQGAEGTTYVTPTFLDNLAKQVPGLNYNEWLGDLSNDSSLTTQVSSDERAAAAAGYNSTPTIVIKGPKGQAAAISGVPTGEWSQIQKDIKAVR